jgi:hypothetical protein
MRVDMRRWVLVLCCIGVMGGGCSARALLGVGFMTDEGAIAGGQPAIVVEWNDDTVRTVPKLDPIDVTDGAPSYVGVYLDYEGSVHVRATVTKNGCEWQGESEPDPVVRRGERTNVTIVVSKFACTGADGGAPDAEAGVDGSGDAEVGPTLVGDAGDARDNVAAKIAACSEYCTAYRSRCSDWRETPLNQGDCVERCIPWAAGEPGSMGSDTLACRWTFLRSAVNPDLRCSTCPAASPESPGMCNALPQDAGDRGECPIPPRTDGGDAS